MISPEEIKQRAFKLWNSQKIQKAWLEGKSLFPWEISFGKPAAGDLSERFPEIRDWIRRLKAGSKETIGHGYALEFRTINNRRLGNQSLPVRVIMESLEDFLRFTGKKREFEKFVRLANRVREEWPGLRSFLARKPSVLLDFADDWDCLLAVCRYFADHPQPGLYIRQLDIPGVDTKFIELRRGILAELLGEILTEGVKQEGILGLLDHGFERRFGLRYEPPLIRFRLLDPALAFSGLTDFTVPLPEFRRLSLPLRRVFVTENKMNGLCFPECPEALVIFGLGYGIGALVEVPWLKDVELYYWGDIDTHGFAMLSRFRALFHQTRSFLMDRETLERFRGLWVKEDLPQRFTSLLEGLTPEEISLFQTLRDNELGDGVRLEQERVSYSYIKERLAKIF